MVNIRMKNCKHENESCFKFNLFMNFKDPLDSLMRTKNLNDLNRALNLAYKKFSITLILIFRVSQIIFLNK